MEILSIYLFVCLSVITSYSLHYSDSKLTQPPPADLSYATSPMVSNVPHPCLPCLPVNWSPFPVNWSPNEQDHITDQTPPLDFRAAGEDDKDWFLGRHLRSCCAQNMLISLSTFRHFHFHPTDSHSGARVFLCDVIAILLFSFTALL